MPLALVVWTNPIRQVFVLSLAVGLKNVQHIFIEFSVVLENSLILEHLFFVLPRHYSDACLQLRNVNDLLELGHREFKQAIFNLHTLVIGFFSNIFRRYLLESQECLHEGDEAIIDFCVLEHPLAHLLRCLSESLDWYVDDTFAE